MDVSEENSYREHNSWKSQIILTDEKIFDHPAQQPGHFIYPGLGKEYEPKDKSDLGKLLFFDPILSRDSTISCGSCHKPEFAFADTTKFSIGVGGRIGVRNTPTCMNLRFQDAFFWDGRAKTLEEQALAPIENPDEMDLSLKMQ